MRIAQVVVTDAFAGTERYVAEVSRELAGRGHDVVVVGGNPDMMQAAVGEAVSWRPGGTIPQALRSLLTAGTIDVVNAHMTYAEAVAAVARMRIKAPIVATRHFAMPRGRSIPGRLLAPTLGRAIHTEIAISEFVASSLPERPDAVIRSGVPNSDDLYDPEQRTVVMAQRLEREKDSATGIRAFLASKLAADGWRLVVAGTGSQRALLEAEVQGHPARSSVCFVGHRSDMAELWRGAGLVLATATAEPLGLAVLEAMAAGIPVVASASGGHLETVGQVDDAAMFLPGDVPKASRSLRLVACDPDRRVRLGMASRTWQRANATLAQQVDRTIDVYAQAANGG